VEEAEDLWDIESELREDVTDALSAVDLDLLSSAPANVTIFTPMPSLLSFNQFK
jgi:hypothetical protein